MINQKYVFPSFNILLYAENSIFPQASAPNEPKEGSKLYVSESNRDAVYDLYNFACGLEPEPKHPELTFSERM